MGASFRGLSAPWIGRTIVPKERLFAYLNESYVQILGSLYHIHVPLEAFKVHRAVAARYASYTRRWCRSCSNSLLSNSSMGNTLLCLTSFVSGLTISPKLLPLRIVQLRAAIYPVTTLTTAVACGVRFPGIILSKSYSRLTSRVCILLSSADLSLILLKKFEGLRHSRWVCILIHKVLVIQGALNPLKPMALYHKIGRASWYNAIY